MIDDTLFLAKNSRPVLPLGPVALTQPSLIPFSVGGEQKWFDWRVAADMMRGGPLYMNFRLATAMTSIAANELRPAVYVDSVDTFVNRLTNKALWHATGGTILGNAMVGSAVGAIWQVAIPPISDVLRAGDPNGFRFLTAGFEALVPTTDFSAGGFDVWLTDKALPTRPIHYGSGY